MKKIISLIVFLLFTFATLTACTPSSSKSADSLPKNKQSQNEKNPQITVGLTYIPNIQFAPLYIAEAKGYFKDAGIDVKLRHHGAQEALLGALQSGAEDIVFAGGDEMMQGRSTGIDVVNWATMYQNYPVALIAPKSKNINTWNDLAGKKVGLPGPYGENYYGLLAALEIHGLKNKVKIEYIGYTQAAALKENKVDAIIGFTNNDTISLQNAGIEVVNIPIVEGSQPPLVGVGFGSLSTKIQPTVYKKFLDAVEKAVKDAMAAPAEAVEITKKYVPSLAEEKAADIALKVLAQTLKLYQGNGEFGRQDRATWEKMEKFLTENKILEKPVKASEAYTTAVLEAK